MSDLTIAERLDQIAALPGAGVAFDGCHKHYVLQTRADREEAEACGYNADDIFPAMMIHALWEKSCFLRFVSHIDLAKRPWTIEQGEE